MTLIEFPNHLHQVPDGHLTGPDLAQRAGLTYRRLDYWTRIGLLHCTTRNPTAGTGYPRHYPTTEVAVATLIRALADGGIEIRQAHDLARQLLDHGHAVLAGITIHLPQEL